jgi:quercetin dioxygenase-like cupin family protein
MLELHSNKPKQEQSIVMDAGTGQFGVHRPAGDGDAIWAMGSLFEMKLAAIDTDGALGIAEVTQPPGIATPLHVHTHEAEVFYVLDGQLDYEAGGQLHHLRAGSLMYLPRGVPHRFRIRGESAAKILVLAAPGGLLDLYRQVGSPATERTTPPVLDPEEIGRWGRVAPEFGLEVLGPPLDP